VQLIDLPFVLSLSKCAILLFLWQFFANSLNLTSSQKKSKMGWLSKNRQIQGAQISRNMKRTQVRCNDETICSNAGAGDFFATPSLMMKSREMAKQKSSDPRRANFEE
jgi:hypothetical protein